MTIDLFCVLLVAFGAANTAITEVVKKFLESLKVEIKSGIVAIICGSIVGVVGTFGYYFMNGIPITTPNVVFAIVEGLCVIIGSQVGYDKIVVIIKDMANSKTKEKTE